jgi:hypothetical protein
VLHQNPGPKDKRYFSRYSLSALLEILIRLSISPHLLLSFQANLDFSPNLCDTAARNWPKMIAGTVPAGNNTLKGLKIRRSIE